MDQHTGVTSDLTEAVDQLRASLEEAAQAAARIRGLLPRIAALNSVFDELESIVQSGRRTGAAVAEAAQPPQPAPAAARRARPKLVVPDAAVHGGTGAPAPRDSVVTAPPPPSDAPRASSAKGVTAVATPAAPQVNGATATTAPATPVASPFIGGVPGTGAGQLIAFRLEFEARPGPLDLRAVDDAVSEHPAVRDVALLDYDGRRATLKVWIEPTASAADVQDALTAKARQIFTGGEDISIIALEDVA